MSALEKQIGGSHYKDFAIQPIEFIHRNSIPYEEGCVIKYMCRWKSKGGIKDLEKAKHVIELMIELSTDNKQNIIYCTECHHQLNDWKVNYCWLNVCQCGCHNETKDA